MNRDIERFMPCRCRTRMPRSFHRVTMSDVTRVTISNGSCPADVRRGPRDHSRHQERQGKHADPTLQLAGDDIIRILYDVYSTPRAARKACRSNAPTGRWRYNTYMWRYSTYMYAVYSTGDDKYVSL